MENSFEQIQLSVHGDGKYHLRHSGISWMKQAAERARDADWQQLSLSLVSRHSAGRHLFGGHWTPVVRLVRVFEKDLNTQDAVWTQVVGDVVDLDVFWKNELLVQFVSSGLRAGDTDLRLVLRCHL